MKFTKDDIAFVYGSKWKQRYFTKAATTTFLSARNGTSRTRSGAPTLPRRIRLVDRILSARQHAAPDRPAVRRLPFRQLQHPDQDRHRVERRLREVPWPRRRARAARPSRDEHREPGPSRLRPGDQCLHPVPFAGPAAEESRSRANTTIGRWASRWARISRITGSWKTTSSASRRSLISPTAPRIRIACRATISSKRDVHARVSCYSCHDVHGTENNADLLKPANVLCLECHGPNSPNGPHAPTIEAHTHHKAGSAGNECVSCHMPKIEQTIADVNVRSHTFRFITPAATER